MKGFVLEHLGKMSLSYSAADIINCFYRCRLIEKNNDIIRFKFDCVYHYFLAMYFSEVDDSLVYTGDNYLILADAIDYYTGLVKNNRTLVEFLIEKSQKQLGKNYAN